MRSRSDTVRRLLLTIAASAPLLSAGCSCRTALAQSGNEGANSEYRALDGSLTCRLPQGWRLQVLPPESHPRLLLLPEVGNDREIQVNWTIARAPTIEELAAREIADVQRLGGALAEQPTFSQVDGFPAVEVLFAGVLPNGLEIRWWVGRVMKGMFVFRVEGLALPQAAPATQEAARSLFQSLRLGEISENLQVTRAIVGPGGGGRWSRLEKISSDNWVVRQWRFDPDGRYYYLGISDFRGNSVETRESGAYKVYGNLLYIVPDQGLPGTHFVVPAPPDGLQIDGKVYSWQ